MIRVQFLDGEGPFKAARPSILLDDRVYDSRVDQFLDELPTMGVRSPRSVRAYAYDLAVWIKAKSPLQFMCQPMKCANACLRPSHRETWELELNRAQTQLKNGKRYSALQRAALRDDIQRIESFIADARSIDTARPGE